MNAEQSIQFVNHLYDSAMSEIVKRQYFVLIFRDNDGELHGYDTKAPARCLQQVKDRNPTFTFVHAVAETAEASVRSLCATLRTAREIRMRVKECEAKAAAGATRA